MELQNFSFPQILAHIFSIFSPQKYAYFMTLEKGIEANFGKCHENNCFNMLQKLFTTIIEILFNRKVAQKE